MAVTTKKTFNAVGTGGQGTTTFTPISVELNNQDDLDVYVTLSGGTRVLQYRQASGSTTDSNHPQVNDTTGLYFPPQSTGVTLYNYTLSADNNTITFNSALPTGAVVSVERRTRDGSSEYTNFAGGSTIRHTDLNNAFDESNFTAQEARNKAFDIERQVLGKADGNITVPEDKTITFEGATDNAYETTLTVTDPTADRTVTFPDASGTVLLTGSALNVTSDDIVNGSIVDADINGSAAISLSKLATGALPTGITVDTANITADALDGRYYTETELNAGQLDNRYYTESEVDANFYKLGSVAEIQSGETWAAADNKIATTSAIDARITDLVDDVGGFVPIANETSFPAANPDVNNGAGTLVSIKALASNLTSNGSGVATITNGAGSGNNVTITGLANSTTYAATFGMIVETTTTSGDGSANPPRAYTFHRLVPKATEVTTVAGSISNVNTVAGSISNVNTVAGNNSNISTVAGVSSNVTTVAGVASNVTTVAGIASDVTAVAGDATDIGAVAAKATEIGRLGTADAVADMNTLGTTAIVSDLDTCATNITNINNVGGSIANVNTVASNLSSVNDFGARYRAATNNAGEYSSNNDTGDLYFNTDINAIKVWTGSAWVAGVTQAGDYAVTTGDTFTGNLKLNDSVELRVGTGDDLKIYHDATDSWINNATGDLLIKSAGDDVIIEANDDVLFRVLDSANYYAKFIAGGAVELYHNSNKKFETTSGGIDVTGTLVSDGLTVDGDVTLTGASVNCVWDKSDNALEFAAQAIAAFGASSALQVYNNGTDNYIDSTVGHLYLRGPADASKTIVLQAHSGEDSIVANPDGAVELYYDGGANPKFETTSGGAKVTGDLQMGGTAGVKFSHSSTSSIYESQTAGDELLFKTTPSGGSSTTALTISPTQTATFAGQVLLGTTTVGHSQGNDLTLANSGHCGISIRSGTTSYGNIFFSDGTSGNDLIRGGIQYDHDNNKFYFNTNTSTALTLDNSQNATFTGTVTDSKGELRTIPQLSKSSKHTIVLADAGKHSINSSGGWEFDTSTAFTAGMVITLINNSGSDQTIEADGVTLYNTADGNTGDRILAARGMATVICTASNTYYVSGAGLT